MSEPALEVDVQDIMRRFAREIETERSAASRPRSRVGSTTTNIQLPRWTLPPGRIEAKGRYSLDEFLTFHDEDFINNGYRAILRREPDAQGFAKFLSSLHSGRLSKTEIIGRIRYSREGRATAVPIDGLLPAFLLRTARRVPVAGRILGIGQYFLRLPDIVRNHERLEVFFAQYRLENARRHDASQQALETELARVHERLIVEVDAVSDSLTNTAASSAQALSVVSRDVAEARTALSSMVARHEASDTAHRAAIEDLVARVSVIARKQDSTRDLSAEVRALSELAANAQSSLARLQERLGDVEAGKASHRDVEDIDIQLRQLQAEKADLRAVEALLKRQQEAIAALTAELRVQRRKMEQADEVGAAGAMEVVPDTSNARNRTSTGASLDSFYVDFEQRFRGSSQEIRSRLEAYVPLVRSSGSGSEALAVLDVGCGRGEWLDILREHNLPAQGVDTNENMVELCIDAGLRVVLADALDHLRAQKDASFRAITAFHIIEHVSFEQMIQLIDEALRVLAPGGLAIFETPNPENVLVGACTFYTDPTHRQPLPPALMQFCFEARGFADIQVLRLHPFPVEAQLRGGGEAVVDWINSKFYGPRDFAVVGRKPVVSS